jgi:thioredoxin-like negative regulator of GroEL
VILRLALAVGLLVAVGLGVAAWRRPSRRLRSGALTSVGVRGPAVVEFVTATCAPCRAATPALRRAAADARVAFAQIDVGARPEVARAYGIRTVPTVAVTGPRGRVLDVWTGIPRDGAVAEAALRARSARP